MTDATLERQITRAVLAAIAAHESNRHSVPPDQVAKLIREHVDMKRDLELLVTDIHGKPDPTAAKPDRRTGGVVVQVAEMHDKLTNGGVKADLPTTIKVAIITTAGVVTTAGITGVIQLLRGG